MPQTARKEGLTAQRAQDKESKRARGALSCAECRRLKLKCDKTVPCSSCKRRGCSAICPNGSLITGQGTRFVLADTEKLHQKIAQMSDRIRQLEDALAILQSTNTREPHPLLHRDLLKIKSSLELHSAVEGEEGAITQEEIEDSQYIDAFGTLAIRDDGAATFYGRSAGSESLLIGEAVSPPATQHSNVGWSVDLPPTIASLAGTFPLGSNIAGVNLDHLVGSFLPPWQEAWRLCELYLEQAPWFFGAVTKRQLHEEILPLWYNEAPKPLPSSALSSEAPVSLGAPTKGGAHELALLFVIFCFGALTDMALPPAPDNPEATQYYHLTKAALSLEPVLDRPPSVATVQTLSLMAIYEGLCSGENSIESTWALMGLATKLAQSIGLHRDCARWKLTPAEVQKRRALFWELFITDCWQSLATGRLATFSLAFVDCELPYDPDQTMSDDGAIQPSFPHWKAQFGAECVSAVVQGTLTSRAPRYSIILELDRKVRDMELPLYAQGPPPQGLGLSQTMSHFMPTNYRELTLLYIHRCFFAHAISSNPGDPIKSQYAPSFLAGYRSACTILGSVRQQFCLFPAQIARFWVLWTHAFSAAVMLASVVTHSSQSKVAPAALLELRAASELFAQASTYGGRAVKFLPIIQRLQMKAHQVFLDTNNGIPPNIPNDIFRPSSQENRKDELSIFSGKTHTVTTMSRSRPSPQSSGTSESSRAASDSPRQAYTDNPSFANVHPSLVHELHAFDGHINAQLQNAYQSSNGAFAYQPVDNSSERCLRQQQERQEYERQQQLGREQMEIQMQEAERQRQEQAEIQVREQAQERVRQQQQEVQHQKFLQERLQIEQQQQQQQQQQRESQRQQSRSSRHHQQDYDQQPLRAPTNSQFQRYQQQQEQTSFSSPFSPSAPGPDPTPAHASRPPLSHSLSLSNLQQAYQYQQPHQPHLAQPQHQMYSIHPAYQNHQETPTPTSATTSHYDPHPQMSHDKGYGYWHAVGYTNPSQITQGYAHHYTPDLALKGIAAEDHSLQETWQSYMSKVGSPRLLFDD